MNENLKKKFTDYWFVLVFIALMITSTFFWQQYQSTKKELELYKTQISMKDTLEKLNSKLKDIEDREKNLYPKIDAEVAKLNKNIKELEKIRDYYEKNKPKKEDIENEINKLDLKEVSKRFSDLGYSNTIITSPK